MNVLLRCSATNGSLSIDRIATSGARFPDRYLVIEVPDGTPEREILARASGTIYNTWWHAMPGASDDTYALGRTPEALTFRFDDLGVGRLARPLAALAVE